MDPSRGPRRKLMSSSSSARAILSFMLGLVVLTFGTPGCGDDKDDGDDKVQHPATNGDGDGDGDDPQGDGDGPSEGDGDQEGDGDDSAHDAGNEPDGSTPDEPEPEQDASTKAPAASYDEKGCLTYA